MKSNNYRKLSNRDSFALRWYCAHAKHNVKKKLRMQTKQLERTAGKKEIEQGVEEYEQKEI